MSKEGLHWSEEILSGGEEGEMKKQGGSRWLAAILALHRKENEVAEKEEMKGRGPIYRLEPREITSLALSQNWVGK